MNVELVLNARVEKSALKDGKEVWVGSVDELPGVFSQADTEPAALADLIHLVQDLKERLGVRVVGLNTPSVGGWSWMMQDGQAAAELGMFTVSCVGSIACQSPSNTSHATREEMMA